MEGPKIGRTEYDEQTRKRRLMEKIMWDMFSRVREREREEGGKVS